MALIAILLSATLSAEPASLVLGKDAGADLVLTGVSSGATVSFSTSAGTVSEAKRDGDDAAPVGGDEEVAALAVRDRVGVGDLDVELARLVHLRFDAAVHARAQGALVHRAHLELARVVEAQLDAFDRDVGLADLGAQRVLGAELVAHLGLGPRSGRAARELHLAAAGGDHRLQALGPGRGLNRPVGAGGAHRIDALDVRLALTLAPGDRAGRDDDVHRCPQGPHAETLARLCPRANFRGVRK